MVLEYFIMLMKSHREQERLDKGIQEANLAVVGASGSGKSTFIRCALDLRARTHELVSSKKVSLEGSISLLRLLKINVNDVELAPGHRSHWPERVGDVPTPRIDGVLVLYDVTDESSIDQIPDLVGELVVPNRFFALGIPLDAVEAFSVFLQV